MYFGKPTPWLGAEGNNRTPGARGVTIPRGRRPWHVRTRYAREPGDPGFAPEQARGAASGSPRTEAGDERTREVGQAHSTEEVCEPTWGTMRGGDGGKGPGQGEPAPAKHVPTTESG